MLEMLVLRNWALADVHIGLIDSWLPFYTQQKIFPVHVKFVLQLYTAILEARCAERKRGRFHVHQKIYYTLTEHKRAQNAS